MTIRFEHGALLAVAGLVTGLILTVGLNPLNTETSSPKASLRLAVSQPIPEKKAAPNAAGDVLSVPEMIVEKAAQAVADLVAGVAAKIVSTPRDMAGIDTLTGVYSVDDIDLAHRLQMAGSLEPETLFTPEAIRSILNFTQGLPRMINIVCDKSMLATYARNRSFVESDTVRDAIQEINGATG